jgi:hypothetical protein
VRSVISKKRPQLRHERRLLGPAYVLTRLAANSLASLPESPASFLLCGSKFDRPAGSERRKSRPAIAFFVFLFVNWFQTRYHQVNDGPIGH